MSTVPTNLINVDLFPMQEVTGAEILNTGLTGHMWAQDIHVSSLIEQHGIGQEQELTEYLGTAIQDAIDNYDPTVEVGYVYAPTFELASNPTIRVDEIKARRFIIFDRFESSYLFDNIENRFKLMDFS